ncbi:MAG: type II secretion system GspH family protein [Deferribacteraceae bacterium]|jgi:prepilin-type N-terminal cleavage/methylation domain-containing protein|nr:type II secretion system GspH family protein [Deferribacteraceae bacterium]
MYKNIYKNRGKNNGGFTLVELAIALAVMGILTGIGISGARAMRQAWEVQEMRLNAELAMRTLEEFTIMHRRLPSEKEFSTLNLPKQNNGSYIYLINPALAGMLTAEQYCEYRYDKSHLLTPDPANKQVAVPYAYAVDFEPSDNTPVLRHLKSYDDFRADLRCRNSPTPDILTKTLPSVKKGSGYNTDIIFHGGETDYIVCIGILNENERERAAIIQFFENNPYFTSVSSPAPVCSALPKERKSGKIFNLSSGSRTFIDNISFIKLRIAVSSLNYRDSGVTVRDFTIRTEP